VANRKIRAETPALFDLTATIFDIFGVEKPKDVIGTTIF
jgi:hypothetical protein